MATIRKLDRIVRNRPSGRTTSGMTSGTMPVTSRTATATPRRHRRGGAPSRQWAVIDAEPKAHIRPPHYTSILSAPADLVFRAVTEKQPWVQRLVNEGCPPGKLLEYAKAYAQSAGKAESEIPPYTTLNTWAHQLRTFGPVGLVDRARVDTARSRSFKGQVEQYFRIGATGGLSTSEILGFIIRQSPAGAPIPGYYSVRRALKRFEADHPHLVAFAREGRHWFSHRMRLALSHGLFPGGYRLAIDSTVLDLWIKVPHATMPGAWEARRPVLTVIQDVGTRLVVTFNLSFYAINSDICRGVLGRALTQDRNYPGLYSVGVPCEFTMDKGAEHQAAFRAGLQQLGIIAVPRTHDDPRAGASIERIFGTINTEVLAHEPGYVKKSKIFDPYAPAETDTKRLLSTLKYDPPRDEVIVPALLTVEQLEARLLAWAIVHNQRPHPSLPAQSSAVLRVLDQLRAEIPAGSAPSP